MGRTVSLDWIHISRMYVFSTVCCHTEGVNCTELFQKYKYFKRIRVVRTEVSINVISVCSGFVVSENSGK